MTKRELAINVLTALINITPEKAVKLADANHGEFANLMKNKKSHLEEMSIIADRVKNWGK